MKEELNDFWQIALEEMETATAFFEQDSDDDDNDDATNNHGYSKLVSYKLPNTSMVLELRPLKSNDGIWSPVGADAWYASALLTTILMTQQEQLPAALFTFNANANKVILELGSGAVGLSGLACAIAMGQQGCYDISSSSSCTIYLTDNDPPVLEQLRANVAHNRPCLSNETTTIHVTHLDWNDTNSFDRSIQDPVDVVIGSELVYTDETATSCTNLLLHLLQRNRNIVIFIVQVTDRYGWNQVLVPRLQQAGASIQQLPLSTEIHDVALTLIAQGGGTLDPHAYGAFVIQNEQASV
jgi:hypothetical protein